MKDLRPRHTSIRQIIDIGDGFIILENPFKFPQGESNLYKIDYDFKPIWDAEFKTTGFGTDHYANFVHVRDNGELSCSGGIGDDYLIDPKTGKIVRITFTK